MTTINDKLGYIATTNEQQTEIHNGHMYEIDADGSIPALSSLLFLGKVGDKEVHFHTIAGQFAKGGIRISLFEAPVISNNGTTRLGTNLNRNYKDNHTLQVFSSPTVTSNGYELPSVFFPLTGLGVNVLSASISLAGGRILKRNTDYLIKIENTDNSAVKYGVNFIWSESDVYSGA